jgi:heat-inducible transcriptional repressor
VPSIDGYRFYIDHLLKPPTHERKLEMVVNDHFAKQFNELTDIYQASARLLSELTGFTAFALEPAKESQTLTDFRLIRLNKNQALAIIVTDNANYVNKVIALNDLSEDELEKLATLLRERLVGENMMVVYGKLRTEIVMALPNVFTQPQLVSVLLDNLWGDVFETKIHVAGRLNLLSVATTKHDVAGLYDLLETPQQIEHALLNPAHKINADSGVSLAGELGREALKATSLVTKNINITNHGNATLAILGPVNMQYNKMLSILDVVGDVAVGRLEHYFEGSG